MLNFKSLEPLVNRQDSRELPPAVKALGNEILTRYGNAAQAVLFYGSCFRSGDASEGLVDLYLLVDDYRSAYGKWWPAFINKLLPPNVFYLEIPFEDGVIRAKYTVLSLADFRRGTSMKWFHSYLWGRFAQPTGIMYARNESISEEVQTALAQAVITFVTRTLPQVPAQFDARQLWHRGFSLSYRSELRSERQEKLIRLVEAASGYYLQMTQSVMDFVPFQVEALPDTEPLRYNARIPSRVRFAGRWAWRLRFAQGKILSVLRLLKALFTFKGGVDYVLWKIERHSGITIEAAPRLRRIPIVGLCIIFWQLYRRGAFR
jgi:hypothetical protein